MYINIKPLIWAAALTVLGSCGNKSVETETSAEKTYPVVNAIVKDTVLSVPYVADIQAKKNVELRSRVDGMLEKIYINEGQRVSKGQLLFKISDAELQIELSKATAAFKSAQADAKVAKVEVERVETLVNKKIITKTELELAQAKYNAALSKVEVALADKNAVEKQIYYTSVLSPFDGVIDRIPLKEGSLVSSNALLTTISDISSVYAYFNISENEYFRLMNNEDSPEIKTIDLVLPDGTIYPYTGQLEAAESEIDASTGNIAFKVAFNNPQKILKHGASGKLLISRSMHNVMLIPQKSVFEIQDKNYVYVVDASNIVKMQSVQVAQRLSDYYVISGGLSPADKIVYEGIQSLREGEKITPETAVIR